MPDNYQRVEAVLAAFAAGEMVIVTDDNDRENEGDLFIAASLFFIFPSLTWRQKSSQNGCVLGRVYTPPCSS